MRVNFADKPKTKAPLYPETEHKLFVGNLAWSVTSESLTQVFQEHGNVVGARVLYDGDSGRSRGYGFVCYSTREEMENAMQVLNGVVNLIALFSFLCVIEIYVIMNRSKRCAGTGRPGDADQFGSRQKIVNEEDEEHIV